MCVTIHDIDAVKCDKIAAEAGYFYEAQCDVVAILQSDQMKINCIA